MVHIYYEITIYIYKEIFPSGASPLNPLGARLPPDPHGGWDPQRGYPPSALPRVEECTFFWGVKSSWGINMAENKDL
jgi:hypothetical protein